MITLKKNVKNVFTVFFYPYQVWCEQMMMRFGAIFTHLLAMGSIGQALWTPSKLAWKWHSPYTTEVKNPLKKQGEKLYFASSQRLFELDTTSGQLKGQYPMTGLFKSSIKDWCFYQEDHAVVLTRLGEIHAVDLKTKCPLWTTQLEQLAGQQVLVSGQNVYVVTQDDQIVELSLKKGEINWKQPYRVYQGLNAPLVAGEGCLYGISKDFQLFSFHLIRKEYLWSVQLKKPNVGSIPIISGNRIIVLDQNSLMAFNLSRGTMEWKSDLAEKTFGSPVVDPEGIAVLTASGNVITLDLNGKITKNKMSLGTELGAAISWSQQNILTYDARKVLQCWQPRGPEMIWTYEAIPDPKSTDWNAAKRLNANQLQAPIISGRNVWLWDGIGSILHFDRNQAIDTTGPEIQLIQPQTGSNLKTGSTILWRVWDEGSGVQPDSIRVELDGRYLKYQYFLEGKISFQVPNGIRGRKVLHITAKDWEGNESRHRFPFYFN